MQTIPQVAFPNRARRTAALVAALAVTALAAAPLLGPPSITVSEVRGTPPAPGAVLVVDGHHHTEEAPDISARAITVRGGRRDLRALALTPLGEPGRFAVARQWEAGQPWLLVFTIRQGLHGQYGTAETMVKVDAQGRVTAIEKAMERNGNRDVFQRAYTEAEVSAALRALDGR